LPSIIATHEFVVPKSIPITLLMILDIWVLFLLVQGGNYLFS
jgi:hypothetical protein